jgi:alkanesulfonate monooxygenase SsuD/methylene tetrahydromethanopterin reductase-like flavin-dependent oxidoreductase (luciferase family)
MEFCILGFMALIGGIVWLVQRQSDQDLERQTQQALKNRDMQEFSRLSSIRLAREQKKRRVQRENAANQRYLDAIMVLDAAEHGVFVPDPEQVFDHLDDDQENNYENEPGDDYEEDNYPEDY